MINSLRSSPKVKRDVFTTKSGRVVKSNTKYAYSITNKCQPTTETISVTNKLKVKSNQSPQASTLQTSITSQVAKKKPTSAKAKNNLPKTRKPTRTEDILEEKSLLSSPKVKSDGVATRSGRVFKTNLKYVPNNAVKCKTPPKKTVTEIKNINKRTNKETIVTEKKPVYAEASVNLFENKNTTRTEDIYDLVIDPNEEPPLQKKKKKRRVIKKKPNAPMTFFMLNNYEKNISKALSNLKKTVSKKKPLSPITEKVTVPEKKQNVNIEQKVPVTMETELNSNHHTKDLICNNLKTATILCNQTISNTNYVSDTNYESGYKYEISSNTKTVTTCNQTKTNNIPETSRVREYSSVRVEDIVADFEPFIDHNNDNLNEIDYSPVHYPLRPTTPHNGQIVHNNRDPLNLLDEGSFFNEPPVANSSMISDRNPEASPWRVEFKKLPIKWPVNTYVKPDMTPAFESSYIDFNDNEKKHVYTNMVPLNNETSPAKSSSDKENNTLFGFDDTEENQENISPVKSKPKKKLARSQARLVLRDLNTKEGPMRAVFVSKRKFTPSTELADKLFQEVNLGAVAPDFPTEGQEKQIKNTNVTNLPIQEEDSQSIHLFEDLEVTHHLKPTRKSYGKAKRVAFREQPSSDSSDEAIQPAQADETNEDDDYGDLAADLSYVPPAERPKTTKRKNKKRIKKQDLEADAWAAEFNSMCKDVDEFPLNVE